MKYFRIELLLFSFSICVLISCEKEKDEINISRNYETRSHNLGQNCFNCHKKDGPGTGIFTIAGSVFDSTGNEPKPNGKILMYSGPNGTGTLIKTLQVDARGNFFTTEVVNISGGVYSVVVSPANVRRYMPEVNKSGQCNYCHNGIDVSRLWVP